MSYQDLGLTPSKTPFGREGGRYNARLLRIYQEKSTQIEETSKLDYGKLYVKTDELSANSLVGSLSGMIISEMPGIEIKTETGGGVGKKSTPRISYVPLQSTTDYYEKNETLMNKYAGFGAEQVGTKFVTEGGTKVEKPQYNFKRCMLLLVKLDEPYLDMDVVGIVVVNFKALENYFTKVEKKRKDLIEGIKLPMSNFTYALENVTIFGSEVDGYFVFDFKTTPYSEKIAKINDAYLKQPEGLRLAEGGLLGTPQLTSGADTSESDSLFKTESTIGQENQEIEKGSEEDLDKLFNS